MNIGANRRRYIGIDPGVFMILSELLVNGVESLPPVTVATIAGQVSILKH
jgi:hypothetical protein